MESYRLIECWSLRGQENLQISPELTDTEPEVLLETAVVICIVNGKFGHVPLALGGVSCWGEVGSLLYTPRLAETPLPHTY